MKFEISLFKFDHQSDYLPYYTKHYFTIKEEKNLLDIFNTINEDEPFSFENSEKLVVAINGVYTTADISVDEIKATFGNDIIIDPASIRRAKNDLIINDDDFKEKFNILSSFASLEILEQYIDKDIQAAYESYKIYFYASNTLNYEKAYIGDAILLLASDLIEKYPAKEKEILKALKKEQCGIEYHTSLVGRIFNLDDAIEKKIKLLKEKLHLTQEAQNFRVNKTLLIDFGQTDSNQEVKHSFKDFNLAYYEGTSPCDTTTTLLNSLEAKVLNLQSMKFDLALDTFHVNPDLTYKLVSTVMLDAFDQNADLLIVDSEELFYLFDYNRKELSRVAGREVNIPIIHKNELVKLVNGSHISVQETLNKHSVNPELI